MIPHLNELTKLSELIIDNGMDKYLSEADITFCTTQEMINKINEDIFYRNKTEGEIEKDPEEIQLNINGLHFKYIVK